MKIFLRPVFLFTDSSSEQLSVNGQRMYKLPLVGLPRNNVVRIADGPDMTIAVYGGHKAINQTNKLKTSVWEERASRRK